MACYKEVIGHPEKYHGTSHRKAGSGAVPVGVQ